MADALYDDARNNFLGNGVHGETDLDTDDIRVILYDEGADALNLADVDLADILAGARIAVSPNLTSKTVGTAATGAFDHADETYTTVSGASVESLVYYEHNATEGLAPLLFNIDGWTGLPFTPNGGNVILQPAAGGVFQLLGA
jgi:hypothetical protein